MVDLTVRLKSLSHFLDNVVGTENVVRVRRRRFALEAVFVNLDHDNATTIIWTGSKVEGFDFHSSDSDMMLVDKRVNAIDCNIAFTPSALFDATFRMIYDSCHPGFVLLETVKCTSALYSQCFLYRGRVVLSSDMYRSYLVQRTEHVQNGPCVTWQNDYGTAIDCCPTLKCSTWPVVANEFISRKREYGWPPSELISDIVNDGCYCVPKGDGLSNHSCLQWRISFASAEIKLIRSLTHLEFKVNALLKIFNEDVFVCFDDNTDNEPLLSTYNLKTILFHVKENSPPSIWTDNNIFECFWMCFNFLIAAVENGHLPNYFIPGNNLFRKRIHGENKEKLIKGLHKLRQQRLTLLYESEQLLKILVSCDRARLTSSSLETLYDKNLFQNIFFFPKHYANYLSLGRCLHLLTCSNNDVDIHTCLDFLQYILWSFTSNLLSAVSESTLDNKTMYNKQRQCKHYLLFNTHRDVSRGWLTLATYFYLIGQYRKSLSLCQYVKSSIKPWSMVSGKIINEDAYQQKYCGQGINMFQKMREVIAETFLAEQKYRIFPSEIVPEMTRADTNCLHVDPRNYASFLAFLCGHKTNDTESKHVALSELKNYNSTLQGDEGGNQDTFLVCNLIGICYEIVRDYQNAKIHYMVSAQKEHRYASVSKWRLHTLENEVKNG